MGTPGTRKNRLRLRLIGLEWRGGSILTLIEGVGGELGQAWVHAVLHCQAVGLDSQQHQPLKERLRQSTLCSLHTKILSYNWLQLSLL